MAKVIEHLPVQLGQEVTEQGSLREPEEQGQPD